MQRYGTQIAMAILLGLLVAAVVDSVRRDATDHALVGTNAATFSIPAMGSDVLAGPQDHLGDVVLLDFWATYCAPCREAMPALQRIHDDYADGDFQLLSVNVDPGQPGRDRQALLRQFRRANNLSFPILLDTGQASAAYNVMSVPQVVLIDRRGTVRFVHDDLVSESRLRDEIDALLAESSQTP